MRERIHETRDADYQTVIQAYVEIEVENSQGEILVAHRDVIGGKNPKLIQTWRGPTLSQGAEVSGLRDFFVIDGGSAVNEGGFHFFLAHFIGWNLPIVTRYDGNDCPLYLETIFPMLFVEQKRGWSVVQGPFPAFFRIQDVARRVMEFLLDLEAAKNRRMRNELRAVQADIVSRWNDNRKSFEEGAARVGRVRGVPNAPSAEFAAAPSIELQIFYQDEWRLLDQVLGLVSSSIAELESAQVQTVDDASPMIEARIEGLRLEIDERSAIIETVRNEFASEAQDLRALETRVMALEADLRKNQDAQKLQTLGSELGSAVSDKICPTCHQNVSSELLPTVESIGMALEENILFVKSQLELYRSALDHSENRLAEISARYRGTDRILKSKQQELRSLRQDLLRPSAATSRATIEQIVRLQSFLETLKSVSQIAYSLVDALKQIATEWVATTEALRRLPSDELTISDKRKITELEKQIHDQLKLYGFRSFQPTELSLSNDNFRPLLRTQNEGDVVEKEINFEISASDAIRLKWAYYLSSLGLRSSYNVNHPGIVVFDEPGQQEMDERSLFAFLSEAARIAKSTNQVIVSTSDSIEAITASFGQTRDVHITSYNGFILQPIADA